MSIVVWAKTPDANASDGVPTNQIFSCGQMVGTAPRARLCPPYVSAFLSNG